MSKFRFCFVVAVAFAAAVMFNMSAPAVTWAQDGGQPPGMGASDGGSRTSERLKAPGPGDSDSMPMAAPIEAAPSATAPAVLQTVRFICVSSQPGQACPTACAQVVVNNPDRAHMGKVTCDSYPCDLPVTSMGITLDSRVRVMVRPSVARASIQAMEPRLTAVDSPLVIRFQAGASDAGYACVSAGAPPEEPDVAAAPDSAPPPSVPRAAVPPKGCGNGYKNKVEACDDGNVAPGDGCNERCQFEPGWEVRDRTADPAWKGRATHTFKEVCGNGVTTPGEECDDGSANSDTTPNACRKNCTKPFCGDRVVDGQLSEECDVGLDPALDTTPNSCRTNCKRAACGDGVVDTGEECDAGSNNNNATPDACRTTCKKSSCGDGVVDTGETCEKAINPYCKADCSATNGRCGDSTLHSEAGEECDDGNTRGNDGCDARCRAETPREEADKDGRLFKAYNAITFSWVSGVMWGNFQPNIRRIGRRPVASAKRDTVLATGFRLSFTPILGETDRWFPVISGQWNINGGLDDQGDREWTSKINVEVTAGVGRCFLDKRTLCFSMAPLLSYQSTGLELVTVRNADGSLEKKDWFSSIGFGARASVIWQFWSRFFMGADLGYVDTVQSQGVLDPDNYWITWFSLGVTSSP